MSRLYRLICVTATIASIAVFSVTTAVRSQESNIDPLLLSATIVKIDLSQPNAETRTTCALVSQSGQYHIEKRVQILPERKAKLAVYEGKLSDSEYKALKLELDDSRVASLPPYKPIKVPTTSYYIENAHVEIRRDDFLQKAGYSIWRGPEVSNSFEGADTEFRDAQLNSKSALSQILEWPDQIKRGLIANPSDEQLRCVKD